MEWEVVILFGLNQALRAKSPTFPKISVKKNSGANVCFANLALNKTLLEKEKIKKQSENQRLFYVAMTRAKRCLLAADWADFAPKTGENGSFNQLTNGLFFAKKQDFTLQKNTHFTEEKTKKLRKIKYLQSQADEKILLARKRAQNIPQLHYPHLLSDSYENLYENEIKQQNNFEILPKDYGIWFHKIMQKFPYKKEFSLQKEFINKQILKFQKNQQIKQNWLKRGQKELNLLLENEFFIQLQNENVFFLSEFSFSFKKIENILVEGIIDLILIDKNDCFSVIDWKTDFLNLDERKDSFQKNDNIAKINRVENERVEDNSRTGGKAPANFTYQNGKSYKKEFIIQLKKNYQKQLLEYGDFVKFGLGKKLKQVLIYSSVLSEWLKL